jgi:hypothetical protein
MVERNAIGIVTAPSKVLTPLDALAKDRANSANTPRRLKERPFLGLRDLARLLRHMQECVKRSQLS